jgi:hypothetical protein
MTKKGGKDGKTGTVAKVAAVPAPALDGDGEGAPGEEAVATGRQRRLAGMVSEMQQARIDSSLYDMKAKADEMVVALRLAWELYSNPSPTRGRRGRASKGAWAKNLVVTRSSRLPLPTKPHAPLDATMDAHTMQQEERVHAALDRDAFHVRV